MEIRRNRTCIILLLFGLFLVLCSCSSDVPSETPNGTLRIVGIGATGEKVVNPPDVITFSEYDVYHTMLGFGELGKRKGYRNIEYYNFFPEMTLDSTGFEDKTYTTFSDYGSLMDRLKTDVVKPEDRTVVIISSHGTYNGTKINPTDTSAYKNASILTVKKEGSDFKREDIKMETLDNDLNSLEGTVVAFLQVCYAGSAVIGDTVIANTDVYPEASVFKNLFDRKEQPISNHVFYLCSCPYYSKSVGEKNGEHSYFFRALQKGIGMDCDTFKMGTSVPAARNGLLTLAGLAKYVREHGGVYKGTGSLSGVEQFPVISGGSQDLIIFNFN